MKKEIVAMLLAGGQGTRLYELTDHVAKPAVHFGGKYRIIDFPLSNCVNSKIETVGVLTQYEPLELTNYIGIGSAWDLDIEGSGVSILSPYQSSHNSSWYEGTAHAIYANLKYLEFHNPEYVVVLSGDHIYKMDYNEMLNDHKKNNADLTIAVMEVPMIDAPRFGIMNTDETMRITEFEEKPQNPKSNLASMGVYIFSYHVLKKYLQNDAILEKTNHDFGMDIIPKIINDNLHVFAYRFSGYWKDVGTIKSLWEANMDLIDDDTIDLFERDFRIFSKNTSAFPQLISENAEIKNCMINEGSIIHGTLNNCVISYDVIIEENSHLDHVVVMPNVIIEPNVEISYAIIQDGVKIKENTKIHGTINDIILISNKYLKELAYE